jgi:hypothetical protein
MYTSTPIIGALLATVVAAAQDNVRSSFSLRSAPLSPSSMSMSYVLSLEQILPGRIESFLPSSVTDWISSLTEPQLAYSPPKYPSPWMDGSGEWADAYARAQDFVKQLTLLEKVNLTTGVG